MKDKSCAIDSVHDEPQKGVEFYRVSQEEDAPGLER